VPRPSRKPLSGLERGYRSGLEDRIALELKQAGIDAEYEAVAIPFLQPAKKRKYKPDWVLKHNGVVIETKGRFENSDRQKHLMVKEQYPDLDLRFVFSNANGRIAKKSSTTYAKWCETHGFEYAHRSIPPEWLTAPARPGALVTLRELGVL
jgi:hypothetical protein